MASRGPYCDSTSARSNHYDDGIPSTHARWDEDEPLPYVSKGFEGAGAGKKSRDKERRRMMDRERGTRDDEADWFDRPKRGPPGLPIRGAARTGRGTRHAKRPWDPDTRETDRGSRHDGLPFGHAHLMSSARASAPANGIKFGKLTLPDDSRPVNKSRKSGNPALAVVNRALGRGEIRPTLGKNGNQTESAAGSRTESPAASGSSSRMKKRRKGRDEERGKDWESEWRMNGNGGGNVADWGRELDREEKKAKVDKGKVSGQRYTGGY